jgi:hypothetical protein
MLCLSDSIRHDDPCVQQLLRTIEEAHTLAQLILAVWPLARVLARHVVEYVLAERAQRPRAWPPCPTCGGPLRSKGSEVTRRPVPDPGRAMRAVGPGG